jgi:hypothetical protein
VFSERKDIEAYELVEDGVYPGLVSGDPSVGDAGDTNALASEDSDRHCEEEVKERRVSHLIIRMYVREGGV